MQISTPETAEQYTDTAKALLQELQSQAQNVANAHPDVGPVELPAPAPAAEYSWPAKVVFTGLLVWERVQVCCSSDPAIRTTTDIWGPTVAIGGISWGKCFFSVPASQLPGLGELTIQVNIASVAVNISWWYGSTPIGTFVGGGVGLGAAVLGGKCKFENGTC